MLSDPPCKVGIVDLQRYPWNLNLIKNMEKYVSLHYFLKKEMQSHFHRNRKLKLTVKKNKRLYLTSLGTQRCPGNYK